MIVGDYFKGDTNNTLKWIQHDAYSEVVGYIFKYPKERYLNSTKLLGIETALAKKSKSIQSFDHRVLQLSHDILAAWFRYQNYPNGQLPLFLNGSSYDGHILNRWIVFFHSTVRLLTESYNKFVISSLQAVCYQNTALGYIAENQLIDIICSHCGTLYWLSEDRMGIIKEAGEQQIANQETTAILSEADIRIVVEDHLVEDFFKKTLSILSIAEEPPSCVSAYNLPQKDCWYVICAGPAGTLDGPQRLICVSKKNAKVIYDEIVHSGG